MALPSNTTVTVDGKKFNAFSAHVGVETAHDSTGMPTMGTSSYTIDCSVNMHDTVNLPFPTLKRLYELAKAVTSDKIVDIKVEFWTDEGQQDTVCTYSFRGWISGFHTTGGGGSNQTLALSFVPELNKEQYSKVEMGN